MMGMAVTYNEMSTYAPFKISKAQYGGYGRYPIPIEHIFKTVLDVPHWTSNHFNARSSNRSPRYMLDIATESPSPSVRSVQEAYDIGMSMEA